MILQQLKSLEGLTDQEKAIVDFLLKNPQAIEKMNGKDLAQASYTSASGVTRLCQKLGFRGYPDFKIRFISELRSEKANFYADLSESLLEEPGNARTIKNRMESFYNSVIYETNSQISAPLLLTVCQYIRKADFVDIYGTGKNYYEGELAAYHLQMLDIAAYAYSAANMYALASYKKDHSHLAFIISHSGRNHEMNSIAKSLKEHKQTVIAMTDPQMQPNQLLEYADLVLPIYATKKVDTLHMLSYPLSVNFIFSLIFYTLLASHPDAIVGDAQDLYGSFFQNGK